MNSTDKTKISKSAMVAVGAIAFVIGLIVAGIFSANFVSGYVPVAVVIGGIALLIYKLNRGGCCGR